MWASARHVEINPPPAHKVSAEPEIKVVERKPGDEFVILACDGIWDVMSRFILFSGGGRGELRKERDFSTHVN